MYPKELQDRYTQLTKDIIKFQKDLAEAHIKRVPTYFSIPKYLDHIKVSSSYKDQLDLASIADRLARQTGYFAKYAESALGSLKCYHEDILDDAFDKLTKQE